MTGPREDNNNSRGIILIVVLWTVTMMTVIIVALSAYSQKNLSLAGVETDRLRSELALQAGLEVGEAIVLARKPEQRIFFDGTPVTADIGGGRLVEISVLNAAGLVDINRADPELISGLIEHLDLPNADAKILIDGIAKARQARQSAKDGDKQPGLEPVKQPGQQQTGQSEDTEANQTEQKQKPSAPAFFSISQLYGLQGADPAAVDKLLPFISLYSSSGKINPMAAPETVLMSIPEFSPEEVGALMTARARHQSKGKEIENILAEHENFLAIDEAKVFVINVKAVAGQGIIAGSRMQATVINDDSGGLPFQSLAWSW